MIKRLAAAASVSVLAVVGLAPAASAATSAGWDQSKPSVVVKIIDWDAPKPAPGGPTTQAIDWD